jgi:hypothetical protein
VSEKHIGYFRLVEACDGPGCPVCGYLEDDSRRQLTTLFQEHVTDVATRRQLRESWGLCNWHTWMVLDTRPTASSVAIVYADLLRVCRQRVEARDTRRSGLLARLRSRLRGAAMNDPASDYRGRPRCPLCTQLRATEAHCLDAVLHHADDPTFESAYQRSAGLCIPHLLGVVERGSGTSSVEAIVQRTLSKWQALRGDLERFVAKHEYRSTEPISREETRAYELALEVLAGRRTLFGSDMRRG